MNAPALFRSAAALLMLSLTACPPPAATLRMRPVLDPRDSSSISPKLKNKKYDRIMIMPPSGTARGEFDTTIALFEKEFITKGITPINGAVTGRVVKEMTMNEKGDKKQEGAQTLSDVERALIMAKETNADALLQIGQFGWAAEPYITRYFVLDPGAAAAEYREVGNEEWQGFQGPKTHFYSPWFTFIGRLTDVSTGEVMASFKVECASNWNLPAEYVASVSNGAVSWENYPYSQSTWDPSGLQMVSNLGNWIGKANERTVEKVIGRVAENILAH